MTKDKTTVYEDYIVIFRHPKTNAIEGMSAFTDLQEAIIFADESDYCPLLGREYFTEVHAIYEDEQIEFERKT